MKQIPGLGRIKAVTIKRISFQVIDGVAMVDGNSLVRGATAQQLLRGDAGGFGLGLTHDQGLDHLGGRDRGNFTPSRYMSSSAGLLTRRTSRTKSSS